LVSAEKFPDEKAGLLLSPLPFSPLAAGFCRHELQYFFHVMLINRRSCESIHQRRPEENYYAAFFDKLGE
jgi:hypothetical protein